MAFVKNGKMQSLKYSIPNTVRGPSKETLRQGLTIKLLAISEMAKTDELNKYSYWILSA